jgi:hypothetical protein
MIYIDNHRDFVVSVWGKDYANGDYKHALHNFITFIEVEPRDGATAKKPFIEVSISASLAAAVQRAWAVMLLKTRYPTNRYLGGDGWETEFSVSVQGAGLIHGRAWSPVKGLPKDLMDLGFALTDYCKTPEAQRTKKSDALIARLDEFATRAAKD